MLHAQYQELIEGKNKLRTLAKRELYQDWGPSTKTISKVELRAMSKKIHA